MDGSSILIEKPPPNLRRRFYDKDGNFSLKVQVVCDNFGYIIDFVSGVDGSTHDSDMWRDS